ncbi:hypothetical protein SK128_001541 [Halocaridina rubra]|uniref:Caspase family p20 domain-containing protein n=1 Tax=Halocaridina rubra TaxID=373956 RepID=A0AAN8ZZA9_HALRR
MDDTVEMDFLVETDIPVRIAEDLKRQICSEAASGERIDDHTLANINEDDYESDNASNTPVLTELISMLPRSGSSIVCSEKENGAFDYEALTTNDHCLSRTTSLEYFTNRCSDAKSLLGNGSDYSSETNKKPLQVISLLRSSSLENSLKLDKDISKETHLRDSILHEEQKEKKIQRIDDSVANNESLEKTSNMCSVNQKNDLCHNQLANIIKNVDTLNENTDDQLHGNINENSPEHDVEDEIRQKLETLTASTTAYETQSQSQMTNNFSDETSNFENDDQTCSSETNTDNSTCNTPSVTQSMNVQCDKSFPHEDEEQTFISNEESFDSSCSTPTLVTTSDIILHNSTEKIQQDSNNSMISLTGSEVLPTPNELTTPDVIQNEGINKLQHPYDDSMIPQTRYEVSSTNQTISNQNVVTFTPESEKQICNTGEEIYNSRYITPTEITTADVIYNDGINNTQQESKISQTTNEELSPVKTKMSYDPENSKPERESQAYTSEEGDYNSTHITPSLLTTVANFQEDIRRANRNLERLSPVSCSNSSTSPHLNTMPTDLVPDTSIIAPKTLPQTTVCLSKSAMQTVNELSETPRLSILSQSEFQANVTKPQSALHISTTQSHSIANLPKVIITKEDLIRKRNYTQSDSGLTDTIPSKSPSLSELFQLQTTKQTGDKKSGSTILSTIHSKREDIKRKLTSSSADNVIPSKKTKTTVSDTSTQVPCKFRALVHLLPYYCPVHGYISNTSNRTSSTPVFNKNQMKISSSTIKHMNTNMKTKIQQRTPRTPTASLRKMKNDLTPKRRVMLTRASARRLTLHSPNHSSANLAQRKMTIIKAIGEGNLELVCEVMSDTGPALRIDKKESTILHIAAANNQSGIVLHLLNLINPNITNKDGQTPAHIAATEGHIDVLRILTADLDFNPYKRDKAKKTYMELLVEPLYDAIFNGDKKRAKALLELGADLDKRAGKKVNGILSRELNVTTPRQLAQTLHGNDFLSKLKQVSSKDKKYRPKIKDETKNATFFTPEKTPEELRGRNMKEGYACILNFKSFNGRPELEREGSDHEVSKLVKSLQGMGYSGDILSSLTAEQVRQTLGSETLRKKLCDAKCAVFVISSHSIDKNSFLTADMKLLTTEWIMNLFNDVDRPHLRNKPKTFVFDFNTGFYMQALNLRPESRPARMEDPLHGMISLCSVTNNYNFVNSNTHKPSFLNILQEILNKNPHIDLLALHRELLMKYKNENITEAPELRNFGFAEK